MKISPKVAASSILLSPLLRQSVSTTSSTSVATSPPTLSSTVPVFRLDSPADFLLFYYLLTLCESRLASLAQVTQIWEMEASFRTQLRGDTAFFPDADDAPIFTLPNRFCPAFAAWSIAGRDDSQSSEEYY